MDIIIAHYRVIIMIDKKCVDIVITIIIMYDFIIVRFIIVITTEYKLLCKI